MLQLAFERYEWLCIASVKAITEIHNKKNLKENVKRAWTQSSFRVLVIKTLVHMSPREGRGFSCSTLTVFF